MGLHWVHIGFVINLPIYISSYVWMCLSLYLSIHLLVSYPSMFSICLSSHIFSIYESVDCFMAGHGRPSMSQSVNHAHGTSSGRAKALAEPGRSGASSASAPAADPTATLAEPGASCSEPEALAELGAACSAQAMSSMVPSSRRARSAARQHWVVKKNYSCPRSSH